MSKGKGTVSRTAPPARTLDAREDQLIAKAVDLAEEQLTKGTASAQVITHFLKLGTTKEQLEKKKLEYEMELLKAKTDNLNQAQKNEELFSQALNAMRRYQGNSTPQGENNEDD